MRIVYQSTRVLAGKFSKPSVPVKDLQGNPIFGQEGQLDRWKEHFESLLNRPPPENPPDLIPARRDLPIDIEPPTEEEIEMAIEHLKSNKAAGPDSIPPEALKADIPTTVKLLHDFLKKIDR